MASKEKRQSHLHWVDENPQTCFCNPVIYVDVTKSEVSSERIAAIFGVKQPEVISLREKESGEEVAVVSGDESKSGFPHWKLEPEKHYDVYISPECSGQDVVPIRSIFQLLPGATEDDKGDRLQRLSNKFYSKIWHDDNTPPDFRDKFYSRSSSDQIQAFRQYDWLSEVFGGPSFRDDEAREKLLLPKVMAKHTSSRMTMEHAVTWLKLMKVSAEEEFPDQPQLQEALGLYWLHFYAFFPFNDDERREFRRLIQ